MKTGNKEYPVEVTSDRPQNIRINIKDAAPGDGYIGFQTSSDQVYISTITFGAAVLYTPSRGDEDKMMALDQHLWTYRDDSFLAISMSVYPWFGFMQKYPLLKQIKVITEKYRYFCTEYKYIFDKLR